MNLEYLMIITLLATGMLLVIQRAEAKKRLLVMGILIIPAILIRNFAVYREVQTEGWVALVLAVILNLLFWVLIGRYNPVPSSDEIRVLGLDD